MNISAVIVAAGRGTRMGAGENKVYLPLLGKPVLSYTVAAFQDCGIVDEIIVVTGREDVARCQAIVGEDVLVIAGGATRQESVYAGLQMASGNYVLIHDGARALITKEQIQEVAQCCMKTGAAALGVASKDTLKALDCNANIAKTLDREKIWQVQTPQAFCTAEILKAHQEAMIAGWSGTDDCALAERAGITIRMVPGSYENIKLTTPEDLAVAEQILKKRWGREQCGMRIGQGYDVHRLTEDRDLILCGVKIPYEKGLLGHSDADVALHALADALLGAAALGDIGRHFPDTDPQYQGADSMGLLAEVVRKVHTKGYRVQNVDVTIICQRPKLAAYISTMQENVAAVLEVLPEQVNVKATTTEKLGFTGRGEGIAAMAVALLE